MAIAETFLTEEYEEEHVNALKRAMEDFMVAIETGLRVHDGVRVAEQSELQKELVNQFGIMRTKLASYGMKVGLS